jgi:hypothetical protein
VRRGAAPARASRARGRRDRRLPSLATVLAGVHWAGTPLALVLFGLGCGWVAARRARPPAGRSQAAASS